MMTMLDFLRYLVKQNGSDLHLCAGRRPHIRIHGDLMETDIDVTKSDESKILIYSILTRQQVESLEKNKELDISYMVPDMCRFRINVYSQRGTMAIAIRAVPFQVDTFEALNIPGIVRRFADKMYGLLLVTGPTGQGKTTTLAAVIDYINSTRKSHIITIEDPIEYIHKSKIGVVNQREIGTDTNSYRNAMKYILRQDADVCLIGEIRDTDSVVTALTLAETGKLVLSTLHSPSAAKSVSRIVDMFAPEYQQQIRTQLSLVLIAVITQQLIPRRDGKGRILACEIMKKTNPIENLIRNYAISQIPSVIQTSREEGMWTMDQYLIDLYNKGFISKYELMKRAADTHIVEQWVREHDLMKLEG